MSSIYKINQIHCTQEQNNPIYFFRLCMSKRTNTYYSNVHEKYGNVYFFKLNLKIFLEAVKSQIFVQCQTKQIIILTSREL